ncbi:MAG TPA: hypothetical protein VF570_19185 [Pyrinomonadaceae bacterium]|jgi:hypothetical protein
MKLLIVAVAVFLLNLPFGYWRSHVPTRSRPWFLAIHLPVPFVIALRVLSGLGWQLASFPVLVGAFFLGQYVGGKWSSWAPRQRRAVRALYVKFTTALRDSPQSNGKTLPRGTPRGMNHVKTLAD